MRKYQARASDLAWISVAGALLACNQQPAAPAKSEPAGVEASYQELAADFASCGEHLEQCMSAAQTKAARWTCRVDFGHCRAEAGKKAMQAMADAIHACVESAKQCKNADDDAGTPECRSQLWACLWQSRHPQVDDGDAGTDEGSASHGHDCIEQLHRSIAAGKSAHVCASRVRQCVADALPQPSEVVPDSDDPDDAADGGDDDQPADESDKPGPSASGKPHAAAHPRLCLQDFRVCVWQTHQPGPCVEALRACVHPAGG